MVFEDYLLPVAIVLAVVFFYLLFSHR